MKMTTTKKIKQTKAISNSNNKPATSTIAWKLKDELLPHNPMYVYYNNPLPFLFFFSLPLRQRQNPEPNATYLFTEIAKLTLFSKRFLLDNSIQMSVKTVCICWVYGLQHSILSYSNPNSSVSSQGIWVPTCHTYEYCKWKGDLTWLLVPWLWWQLSQDSYLNFLKQRWSSINPLLYELSILPKVLWNQNQEHIPPVDSKCSLEMCSLNLSMP